MVPPSLCGLFCVVLVRSPLVLVVCEILALVHGCVVLCGVLFVQRVDMFLPLVIEVNEWFSGVVSSLLEQRCGSQGSVTLGMPPSRSGAHGLWCTSPFWAHSRSVRSVLIGALLVFPPHTVSPGT